MKLTLIFLLVFILVAIIFTIYKQNKKVNVTLYIPNRETDFMKDWKLKVSNAVLNEEVYNRRK